MPGSEFAKKNMIGDMIMRHVMPGRRNNGASSKKKHKPCSTTTTTTIAEKPEIPYSESPSTPVVPGNSEEERTSSIMDIYSTAVPVQTTSGQTLVTVASSSDYRKYPEYDPYSVTPSTPNISEKRIQPVSTANDEKDLTSKPNEMLDVRIALQQPTMADDSAGNVAEMVVVKTVEKSPDGVKTATDVKPNDTINFKENPVSISSDTKTVVTPLKNEMTVQTDLRMNTKIGDKSKEISAAEKTEKPQKSANNIAATKITTIEPPRAEKKPTEKISSKTAIKPTVVESTDAATNTKKINGPVEMVAMKTMETPSFAEALKASRKPTDNTNSSIKTATAVKGTDIISSIDSSKKPTETVVSKTAENASSSAGSKGSTANKSEMPTSTKEMDIQDDKNKPNETPIDSRSTSKVTEMVAVKTMENLTTVKNVISVKEMIKPTQTPKTTHSLNSSIAMMRKVGDRKPLPSITLEVTPPEITLIKQ